MTKISNKLPADTRDATKPWSLRLFKENVRDGVPGDSEHCQIANSGRDKRNPPPEEFPDFVPHHLSVLRNGIRWYNKDESICIRYDSSPTSRLLVAHYNDAARHIEIGPEGMLLILQPVKKARSLAYLRSNEFRTKRKESRLKNKDKVGRRVYRRPDALTLAGVRHGGRGRGLDDNQD
jgi:hypothetical protein